MNNSYFYLLNGVKQDPISAEELVSLAKSGVIHRDTLIWRQGYSDWLTLAESEIDTSFLPPPVIVRRLHDIGHSGWWSLVPIVSLIFCLQPTQLMEVGRWW